jgi:hypothetical protein
MAIALGVLFVGAAIVANGSLGEKAGGPTASTGGTQPASTGGTAPSGSIGQVTAAELQSLGKQYGWTGQQITDWMNVIMAESGGNPTARIPTSGAYGIAQGITGPGWYANYGGNANTGTGQLTAMANYISGRYGTPSAAWAHEQSAHWY